MTKIEKYVKETYVKETVKIKESLEKTMLVLMKETLKEVYSDVVCGGGPHKSVWLLFALGLLRTRDKWPLREAGTPEKKVEGSGWVPRHLRPD